MMTRLPRGARSCQEAVDAKENACAAILAIFERLTLKGALVTIDAIAANPAIAKAIAERGGGYVPALKRNHPSLHGEAARYFDDPATTGLQTIEIADKDHGRIETRSYSVTHDVAVVTRQPH